MKNILTITRVTKDWLVRREVTNARAENRVLKEDPLYATLDLRA